MSKEFLEARFERKHPEFEPTPLFLEEVHQEAAMVGGPMMVTMTLKFAMSEEETGIYGDLRMPSMFTAGLNEALNDLWTLHEQNQIEIDSLKKRLEVLEEKNENRAEAQEH